MSEPICMRAQEEDYHKWLTIKQHIFDKYGKFHSVVAREAIKLMLIGLEHTTTNTHTHRKTKRTKNNYQELLFSMQSYNQITNDMLSELIDQDCGRGTRDIRTYKKYLKFLKDDNILKYQSSTIRPNQPPIQIYQINHRMIEIRLKSSYITGRSSSQPIKTITPKRPAKQIVPTIEKPKIKKKEVEAEVNQEVDKLFSEIGVDM